MNIITLCLSSVNFRRRRSHKEDVTRQSDTMCYFADLDLAYIIDGHRTLVIISNSGRSMTDNDSNVSSYFLVVKNGLLSEVTRMKHHQTLVHFCLENAPYCYWLHSAQRQNFHHPIQSIKPHRRNYS